MNDTQERKTEAAQRHEAGNNGRLPAAFQPAEETYLALPAPLAQALIGYLAQRPFAEVYQMIARLQALTPVRTSEAIFDGRVEGV